MGQIMYNGCFSFQASCLRRRIATDMYTEGRHLLFWRRMFLATLTLTVVMCVLLEIFSSSLLVRPNPPPYGRSRRYVTVKYDNKRLGNIMFNYAASLGIARMTNMTSIYGADLPLTKYFVLNATLVRNVENAMGMWIGHEEFGRRACAYDPSVERLGDINIRLDGYYQSWKYFRHIEREVREHFRFRLDIISVAKEFLHSNAPGLHVTRVGIHVRRGDLLDGYYHNFGYSVATASYFAQAMTYFRKRFQRVQFIVCSDDITWCREHIKDSNIAYSEGNSPGVDLAILSLCDHVIMSIGSFSWWAAWLAGGTVVYYDDWPRPVSQLEYHVTKSDYFYPDWIPISERGKRRRDRIIHDRTKVANATQMAKH